MPEEAHRLKLALFRSTAHAGHGGAGWVSGEAAHRLSAAVVRWHWRVEAGVICAARYEVRGCPDLIAATELAAVALEGQPAAAPAIDLRAIATRIGAPAEKLGKLFIVEDAMRAAAIQFGES
jgi:NifU-like protein involved in Fe-S cluster formation